MHIDVEQRLQQCIEGNEAKKSYPELCNDIFSMKKKAKSVRRMTTEENDNVRGDQAQMFETEVQKYKGTFNKYHVEFNTTNTNIEKTKEKIDMEKDAHEFTKEAVN